MSRIVVAFCCWLAMPGVGQAQTYKVGVQAVDYFPIAGLKAPDNTFHGYAREVLDRFAQREGIQFNYIPLPPRRMIAEYWSDKLDFAFPDNPNWDAAEKTHISIAYSQPLISFEDAVFTLPTRKAEPLEQLNKLGVLLGWTPWKFRDRIQQGKLQVVTAPSPNSLIRMAISGRVDGANLAEPVARYHLQLLGAPAGLVANHEWMPRKQSSYYLSSIRHADLIKRFDRYLREDGAELARLRARYGL